VVLVYQDKAMRVARVALLVQVLVAVALAE
jgi:hypothetical protein